MSAIRQLFSGRRRDVDMTEGNIVHHLIAFAIPLCRYRGKMGIVFPPMPYTGMEALYCQPSRQLGGGWWRNRGTH